MVGGSNSRVGVLEILIMHTKVLRVSNAVKQALRKDSKAEHRFKAKFMQFKRHTHCYKTHW